VGLISMSWAGGVTLDLSSHEIFDARLSRSPAPMQPKNLSIRKNPIGGVTPAAVTAIDHVRRSRALGDNHNRVTFRGFGYAGQFFNSHMKRLVDQRTSYLIDPLSEPCQLKGG